jgi:hypothetical protein
MGRRGRQEVEREYDIRVVGRRLLQVYAGMSGGAASPA